MNPRSPDLSSQPDLTGADEPELPPGVLEEKAKVRTRVKARLRNLPENDKSSASLLICHLASRLPAFQNAQTIAFFCALPSEPRLDLLMELAWAQNKNVIVPRIPKKPSRELIWVKIGSMEDLVPATSKPKTFLMEPRKDLPEIGLDQLECIFVPGLAFDHAGWRLGRGGGYYDFALAQIRANAKHGNPIPHPGLMFACQEVEKIPAEAHDQRLSCVLTEEGLRLFPGL